MTTIAVFSSALQDLVYSRFQLTKAVALVYNHLRRFGETNVTETLWEFYFPFSSLLQPT